MKALKIILPSLLSISLMIACNGNESNETNSDGTSPGVNDTTSSDPTTDALDHHPDQRQNIPVTDSSNTIGTDTVSKTMATPNTGEVKDSLK
jgi:hypothetical protein